MLFLVQLSQWESFCKNLNPILLGDYKNFDNFCVVITFYIILVSLPISIICYKWDMAQAYFPEDQWKTFIVLKIQKYAGFIRTISSI